MVPPTTTRRVGAAAAVAAMLASLLAATPLRAQAPARQAPDIPRAFALALLGGRDVGELLVGRAPPGMADTLALDGWGRVVGSFTSRGWGMTVLAAPGTEEEALAAYEERLSAHGWHKATLPGNEHNGGFQSTQGLFNVHAWCADARTLDVAPVRIDGTTYLRVTWRGVEHTLCDPRAAERPRAPTLADVLPPLYPPDGADVEGGGVGGNGDALNAGSRITTERPVDEIADHYEHGLVAAGWQRDGGPSDPDAAMRRYRLTTEDGDEWVGWLSVGRIDARTLYAQVRAVRRTPSR